MRIWYARPRPPRRDPGAARRPLPRAGRRHERLDELADDLADRLNTRVKIGLSARKGQISIDFATVEDLERILRELGQDPSSRF